VIILSIIITFIFFLIHTLDKHSHLITSFRLSIIILITLNLIDILNMKFKLATVTMSLEIIHLFGPLNKNFIKMVLFSWVARQFSVIIFKSKVLKLLAFIIVVDLVIYGGRFRWTCLVVFNKELIEDF